MSVTERDLAHVDQAKAYQIGEYLLVRIVGELPTPCHSAFLEQSLLTVEPPTFHAGWFIRPDMRCAQVVTPYEHHEVFQVGVKRDVIVLHHADGEVQVDVEELTPSEDGDAVGRAAPVPGAVLFPDEPAEPAEAAGYSNDFDFGEAFRDAIGKLPPQFPQIPDWLSTYTVTSIQAEIGGIAGFNRLVVRVRQ